MNISGFLWKNNGEGVLYMNFMNVKLTKVFYFTAVIVVACVIASAIIAPITTPSASSQESSASDEAGSENTYVLTCDGDRIVAYIKGADRPYIETTTAVSSLPYDVQDRLRVGIEYGSEEELRAAINEYCS